MFYKGAEIEESPIRHLHLGAGAIGLGFVVWATNSETSTIVGNRRSVEPYHQLLAETKSFFVQSEEQFEECSFDDHFFFGKEDAEILGEVLPQTKLLTTSVRPSNFNAVAALIADSIRTDYQDDPLYICAFENKAKGSEKLVELIYFYAGEEWRLSGRPLVSCNVIVDRICRKPKNDTSGEIHRVVVPVEDSRSCFILAENDSAAIMIEKVFDTQRANIEIVRQRRYFELLECQKFWCINAIDYAAATFGYLENFSRINAALDKNDKDNVLEFVEGVAYEAALALVLKAEAEGMTKDGFSERDATAFVQCTLERLKKSERQIISVLGDLGTYEDFQDLFDKFATEISVQNSFLLKRYGDGEIPYGDKFRILLKDQAQSLFTRLDLSDYFDKVNTRLGEPAEHLFSQDGEPPMHFFRLIIAHLSLIKIFLDRAAKQIALLTPPEVLSE